MKFTEYDDVALELSFPDNVTGAKKWFETYLAPHLKYSQSATIKQDAGIIKDSPKQLPVQKLLPITKVLVLVLELLP